MSSKKSKITGHASPEATATFAGRMRTRYPSFEPSAYRSLVGTDLITSKVGYGSYRVHNQSEEHSATLKKAIEAGCNLIDTSSNYTDGGSETLIGDVLRDLIEAQTIQREEIIVVSKVGYMQGKNLNEAVQREQVGQPYAEVVKYMEGCWHCIHPDFLIDQCNHSANRLGLETIDVYLLHNPEYFLSDAQKRSRDPAGYKDSQEAYYNRIYRAFVQMEQLTLDGKIRCYGISSNTFPSPESDFEHTSLDRVYEAACKAGATVHGNHRANHFKVIQLPYNLFEHGAFTTVNNEIDRKNVTVLEGAKSLGIGVLVNRPLNAIVNNGMTRLAQYPYDPNLDYPAEISNAERRFSQIETELEGVLKSWGIFESVQNQVNLNLFYDIAQQLPELLPRVQNRDHWEQILYGNLIPQIRRYLQKTAEACSNEVQAEWEILLQQYVESLNALFAILTDIFNRGDAEKVEPIQQALERHLSDAEKMLTFSQKALNFVTSSPGVSVVLNGMKRKEYVHDAMGIMDVPDFKQPPALIESVADAV